MHLNFYCVNIISYLITLSSLIICDSAFLLDIFPHFYKQSSFLITPRLSLTWTRSPNTYAKKSCPVGCQALFLVKKLNSSCVGPSNRLPLLFLSSHKNQVPPTNIKFATTSPKPPNTTPQSICISAKKNFPLDSTLHAR